MSGPIHAPKGLGLLLHLAAAPLLAAAFVTGRVEPVVGAVACLAVANVARRHGEAPAASSGGGIVEAWRADAEQALDSSTPGAR